MFGFLGTSELALVFILIVVLFNARDMVKVVRFIRRHYVQAQRSYYKLKAQLLYEPPTEEELKAQKETEEFYRKYGTGYNPPPPPRDANGGQHPSSPPPGMESDLRNTSGQEGKNQDSRKPDAPGL